MSRPFRGPYTLGTRGYRYFLLILMVLRETASTRREAQREKNLPLVTGEVRSNISKTSARISSGVPSTARRVLLLFQGVCNP